MEYGTQTKLAKLFDISDGYLSQIINGIRPPSWNIAKTFSKHTNTSPVFWMDATPEQIQEVLSKVNF